MKLELALSTNDIAALTFCEVPTTTKQFEADIVNQGNAIVAGT